MNLALWIVTGLLAVIFLVAGAAKLFVPKEKMVTKPGAAWVEDFSPGTLRTIATLELLGVVGLILPAALDIAPVLVPLAAVGLALVMVGAISRTGAATSYAHSPAPAIPFPKLGTGEIARERWFQMGATVAS